MNKPNNQIPFGCKVIALLFCLTIVNRQALVFNKIVKPLSQSDSSATYMIAQIIKNIFSFNIVESVGLAIPLDVIFLGLVFWLAFIKLRAMEQSFSTVWILTEIALPFILFEALFTSIGLAQCDNALYLPNVFTGYIWLPILAYRQDYQAINQDQSNKQIQISDFQLERHILLFSSIYWKYYLIFLVMKWLLRVMGILPQARPNPYIQLSVLKKRQSLFPTFLLSRPDFVKMTIQYTEGQEQDKQENYQKRE